MADIKIRNGQAKFVTETFIKEGTLINGVPMSKWEAMTNKQRDEVRKKNAA